MERTPIWFRYTLLALTILGGGAGIVLTLVACLRSELGGIGAWIVVGCAITAYFFVAAAGVAYWRHPNSFGPLRWALAIQIPWVSLPGLVYKFAAGISLSLGFIINHTDGKYSAGLHADWSLGSSWEFRLLQNAPWAVGVNIAPLAALYFLQKLTRAKGTAVEDSTPTSNGEDNLPVSTGV
jgi:hypothetical protein